jgi:hypothetical protein
VRGCGDGRVKTDDEIVCYGPVHSLEDYNSVDQSSYVVVEYYALNEML